MGKIRQIPPPRHDQIEPGTDAGTGGEVTRPSRAWTHASIARYSVVIPTTFGNFILGWMDVFWKIIQSNDSRKRHLLRHTKPNLSLLERPPEWINERREKPASCVVSMGINVQNVSFSIFKRREMDN